MVDVTSCTMSTEYVHTFNDADSGMPIQIMFMEPRDPDSKLQFSEGPCLVSQSTPETTTQRVGSLRNARDLVEQKLNNSEYYHRGKLQVARDAVEQRLLRHTPK